MDFFGANTETKEDERAEKKRNKKRRKIEEAGEYLDAQERQVAYNDGAGIKEIDSEEFKIILKQNKIKLTGLDLPNPIINLAELSRLPGWSEEIATNWNKLEFAKLSAVQMISWSILTTNRDGMVCAPTGSGKTFAFLLPLLTLYPPNEKKLSILKPISLILEPTRELAIQVYKQALKLTHNTSHHIIVLGESDRIVKLQKPKSKNKVTPATTTEPEIIEEVEPIAVDILITTPLKLIYAIKAGTVDLSSLGVLFPLLSLADMF